MKKIAIITGTRAEYGLFLPLIKKIKEEDSFQLEIIATGMHLSPEFGMTYKDIKKDGNIISDKVEMLLSSDTDVGITKSVGLGIIGFADSLDRLKPDMVIVLGDRFETYAATIAAFISKIPICHIHGGELTFGAIDDAFRHSITKMSTFHFATTNKYCKRIIQMGENPERVFNVGALGIDNIKEMELLTKEDLENDLKFRIDKPSILLTYHPETLGGRSSQEEFRILLDVLNNFKNINIIFTMPNADNNGRIIIDMVNEFVKNNSNRSIAFKSLGQKRYLSTLKYVDFVIGNSSSGIIEVPPFKIPTINIGNRQEGRIKAESIINCKMNENELIHAINRALNEKFKDKCEDVVNPYGIGNASKKILEILREIISQEISIKKKFYDIDFEFQDRRNYE